MQDNNRGRSSLGQPRGVYSVAASRWRRIFLLLAAVFLSLFAIAGVLAVPEISTIGICTLPMLLVAAVLFKMYRDALAGRDDVLSLFENGFTYQGGGKLQSCLWEEMEGYQRRPKTSQLMWVEKKNGELVTFADDPLPETQLIADAFDAFVMGPA